MYYAVKLIHIKVTCCFSYCSIFNKCILLVFLTSFDYVFTCYINVVVTRVAF